MPFVIGVRSNVRRLSGTHSAGEGARRARFRERGRASTAVAVPVASGDGASSSVPFRLRVVRRWMRLTASAGAGVPVLVSGEEEAVALVPEGEVEPASREGLPAAGVREPVVAAWATRQVFVCRLRLEATPKRRPQLSHAKAGAKAP